VKNTGIPVTVSIRKTIILISIQWFKRSGQGLISDELMKHPPNSKLCRLHPVIQTIGSKKHGTNWWHIASKHAISEQNGPSEPGRNWPRILAIDGAVVLFSPVSPGFPG
jgi:hypothetical protein